MLANFMVRLPGGRIVRTLFGGEDALDTAIGYLETGKIDGLVKTSFTRNGEASVGNLVMRKGRPFLALYDDAEEMSGEDALYEIARDSVNEDCVIEVRSYSYKSSSVSVSHMGDTHPDALLGVEHDVQTILGIVADEERSRIERERKELDEGRVRERALRKTDDELVTKSEELDMARSEALARSDDLDRIRSELESV
ncbi:MAG: hypothetical protein KAX31_04710, partial [Thermoplasmata archaeon]|nr:hypothetical protein [Thermoplasmata archaeon]